MRASTLAIVALFVASTSALPAASSAKSQTDSTAVLDARDEARKERFTAAGTIADEGSAAPPRVRQRHRTTDGYVGPTEAPTGFDNLTNGYLEQGPPFEELDEDTVVPLRSFNENTSSGQDVAAYDPVEDPEDEGEDVVAFADFMRATKAPARGAITPDVVKGGRLFKQVGCATCHVETIVTAPAGTVINGGLFTVPAALGGKIIHPYSDFLLHDVGTGDGIPFLPTAEFAFTANKIRTAPLWALRTRNRLMHDGLTFTKQEAIQRHAGQAARVTATYNGLTLAQKAAILAFLDSL